MDSKPVYLSAEDLSVQPWERDGLIALVGPLSRNELGFEMSAFHTCETVHCIGGWLLFNAGRKYTGFFDQFSTTLHRLFVPNLPDGLYFADVNSEHAASATLNFLVTGDPQWDRVMSGGA